MEGFVFLTCHQILNFCLLLPNPLISVPKAYLGICRNNLNNSLSFIFVIQTMNQIQKCFNRLYSRWVNINYKQMYFFLSFLNFFVSVNGWNTFVYFYVLLRNEPSGAHMIGGFSATKLQPQSLINFFLS